MVKLASAREARMYGPGLSRNRWEYINAGLYVFATILLLGGVASQLSVDASSGLVVALIALGLVGVVNAHDLVAHMAGIDYSFSLMGMDLQMGLVEFAVPVVQILGTVLAFLAFLFLFLQMVKGYSSRREMHALNMLIAGPALWLLGSIHNACQVYERADSHVQILQNCVQIPLLMGSMLFLVGGVFNHFDILGSIHDSSKTLGKKWVWLCICGSLLFFLGALLNVMKVFKTQQMDGGRLEKLRGGAQDRLNREREGRVPLILEHNRRQETEPRQVTIQTPYRDVLVGGSQV